MNKISCDIQHKVNMINISWDILSWHKKANSYWLYCIKSYFEKFSIYANDIFLDILEYSIVDKTELIIEDLKNNNSVCFAFTCFMRNYDIVIDISKKIKELFPLSIIILWWPEATVFSDKILKNNLQIDFIVRNEWEQTFLELIEFLIFWRGNLTSIEWISYRKSKKVYVNRNRELLDLSICPSPYWDSYIRRSDFIDSMPIILETSRWCPYKCKYCSFSLWFNKVRYISLDRVEFELKYILWSNVNSLWIFDSHFNINLDRSKKIFELIIKYNLNTKIKIFIYPTNLDSEFIDLMKLANVQEVEIWIQTSKTSTLENIWRNYINYKNWIIENNINLLIDKWIRVTLQFIIWLPWENYSDIKNSLDWAYKLRPFWIQVFTLMVIPWTILYSEHSKYGIFFNKKQPYEAFKTKHLSKKQFSDAANLWDSIDYIYNRWFLKKTFIFINGKFNILFSDLLVSWIEFKKLYLKKQLYLKQEKLDLVSMAKLFLDFLIKKENILLKWDDYILLTRMLLYDCSIYLNNIWLVNRNNLFWFKVGNDYWWKRLNKIINYQFIFFLVFKDANDKIIIWVERRLKVYKNHFFLYRKYLSNSLNKDILMEIDKILSIQNII